MSEKTKYTDEPLAVVKVVPDFLPRPKEMVFRHEEVQATKGLDRGRKLHKTEHAGPKRGRGAY